MRLFSFNCIDTEQEIYKLDDAYEEICVQIESSDTICEPLLDEIYRKVNYINIICDIEIYTC